MRLQSYRDIENWTEDDLSQLPSQEDDYWEYKGSLIAAKSNWQNELKEKLCHAASAFWNTGGGVFLVGIGGNGIADGGIPEKVGRQSIRDWVDTILREVQPVGKYAIKIILSNGATNSLIEPDKIVLAIAFDESHDVPHMSNNKIHYIRAGAHTLEAGYYLVEAIRARRHVHQPSLRALIQYNRRKARIYELMLIAINETPALNVQINFDPLPKMYANHFNDGDRFPLIIPIIDNRFPFTMDVAYSMKKEELFGNTPIKILLDYEDATGRRFHQEEMVDIYRQTSPLNIGTEHDIEDLEIAIKQITKQLQLLNGFLQSKTDENKTD